MADRYVVDTSALISFFSQIFKQPSSISPKSLEIIEYGFSTNDPKLIFPSTVFIEIFSKWFRNEEITKKIKIEIYYRILNQDNMHIQPLDKEILENLLNIRGIEKGYNFDGRDKQILASAMTMECPLITSDTKIIRYNNLHRVIPSIHS